MTVTEKKSLPTPDDVSNEVAARSFVETHERRYVYNELVDGFGTTQPATDITIKSTDSAVVYTTAEGYYLLSTCRGSAQYYDPDGSPWRAGRNAASVAHFVGPDIHRRISFNAYRCEEPIVTDSGRGDEDGSSARFQILTRTSGEYSLSVSTVDGGQARHGWSLSEPTDPAWWALSVLITHGDDVAIRTLYPNEVVGLPSTSLCTRMD